MWWMTTLLACGEKAPPAAAAANPEPAPVAPAPPAPEPEPTPEPEAPAVAVSNVSFNVTITYASGQSKAGHVKRLERSDDWFGEQGWLDTDAKLVITGEGNGTEKDFHWTDVKSVSVKPAASTDVDCYYSSEFTPWMYDCDLKTTGTLTAKDGSKWTVNNRHKWRLTFDDDSTVEFWLYKHAAREQDTKAVEMGDAENIALYATLKKRLEVEAKTTLVTGVTISP